VIATRSSATSSACNTFAPKKTALGQWRASGALEHTGVALEGQPDGDVVVAGGHHRESGHRSDVVGGLVNHAAAQMYLAPAEECGEDHQEHQGEREGEEGRSRVAPECLVDEAHLEQR